MRCNEAPEPAGPLPCRRRRTRLRQTHDREGRPGWRGRQPRGGQRSPRRLQRADGRRGQDPERPHGALVPHRARREGNIPLVGDDHADLHAGAEAAVRDEVRRHDRRGGESGQRQDLGQGPQLLLHHADHPAPLHRPLPQAQRRRRHRPALQPAGRRRDDRAAPPASQRGARIQASARAEEARSGL